MNFDSKVEVLPFNYKVQNISLFCLVYPIVEGISSCYNFIILKMKIAELRQRKLFLRRLLTAFSAGQIFGIERMCKMKRRIGFLLLIITLFMSIIPTSMFYVSAESTPVIKNVIYMIPDGGGFALYDFAKAVKETGGFNEGLYPNSTKITDTYMYLKDYLIGTETTHSANNSVTDSAAGGTALSSGYKTNNNYIGVDSQGVPHATLLEAAQLEGKRTGIVATYPWAHATPAAFTAHNISRGNVRILSEQIMNQGLDVVLGVGFGAQGYYGSVAYAESKGYTITNDKYDLVNIQPGTKIWGNHYPDSFPFDIYLDEKQPTLAEMMAAAIRALDGSDKGFFLMVEGSKVDAGGHNNNIVEAVSEYIAFDEAFKVALDFAKARTDTVVIVAPDHDTGGLNLPNPDIVGGNPNWSNYAEAVEKVKGGQNIEKNNPYGISWTTTGHTNRRCGVWMYAPPGVKPPKGLSDTPGDTPENRKLVIDNTEIAPYLAGLMGLDLEAATEELFVDVTDLGTFNSRNNTFTFNHMDISIAANQSVATIYGKPVDLDGKVAVYSEGRFYVPKSLIRNEIKIKTTRYKDQTTGRIIVKGQVDRAFAGEKVSLLMYKKSVDSPTENIIGYVDQSTIDSDGVYVFTFKFFDDVDDYEIAMYLGNKKITDSITEATASYSWLDASVLLFKEKDTFASSEVFIKNYDIEGLTYCIGLAFYDANNKLIQLKLSDIKALDNNTTLDNLKASMPDGTATVKAFIWSNYTQMIPLCEADHITVK